MGQPWKQHKFEEIALRLSVKSNQSDLPRVEYEDIISGLGELNKNWANKKNNKIGIVFDQGDVLYGKLRPYLQNWLLPSFKGIAVGDFWVLRPKEVDSNFLYQLIQGNQFNEVANQSIGSKMPRADWNLVSQAIFLIPDIEEQRQIGSLFYNLDHSIASYQHQIDLLKEQKKGLLQRMFPKEGNNVPELRFPEFTAPWEQRKLGELSEIIGGGTPSTSKDEYWNGDINWFTPAEIGSQIYIKSSQKKITEKGYQNSSAKILPPGTVLFTSRAGIGKTAILTQKGCTNQGFQSIVPHKDKLDAYFIFSRSEELKKYGETVGAGSTFVEVSSKQMANMPLMMPQTLNEQKCIGSFFSNLDSLITLHQRQLYLLKEQKKGLLQKMFTKDGEIEPKLRFPEFK